MANSKKNPLIKGCAYAMLLYLILIIVLYFVGGEQLKYSATNEYEQPSTATAPIGEMVSTFTTTQSFVSNVEQILSVDVLTSTGGKQQPGNMIVSLIDLSNNQTLAENRVSLASLKDNAYSTIQFNSPIDDVKGKKLELLLRVPQGKAGNTVSIWCDSTEPIKDGKEWSINGEKQKGALCIKYGGRNSVIFGNYYWQIMGFVGIVLAIYFVYLILKDKKGQKSAGLSIISAFIRYRFLLHQLVSRDFKSKYKRSVLGVLWSFLNPLLTMLVQYVVFSTLFKSGIANFPVYLLTGIVFFNLFSESTSLGLMSIVGNAPLLTKVYIPKYIFPVSRVFSSVINFALSLIPLFLVVIITGNSIKPAILLLPFSIICTIIFCIGMSFILSSAMVYFRDSQFLWNVVSMLWVYFTPLFYPETILPAKWLFVFKFNPMYHFIRFARTVIMDGISPEPQAYLFCLIASIVPLIIGIAIFKKAQKNFVLYI